jgi:hypothetical protein
MSDEDKPDPIEDVRKGLGLLFRAARTTLVKLPTKDLEDVVTTGVREVGRAIENVGKTIERDVFGSKGGPRVEVKPKDDAPQADPPKPPEGSS